MADLRGVREGPLGVQILSISCSFWEILANSYVGAPWGVGYPPRRNPGSTTDGGIYYLAKFVPNSVKMKESGPRAVHPYPNAPPPNPPPKRAMKHPVLLQCHSATQSGNTSKRNKI